MESPHNVTPEAGTDADRPEPTLKNRSSARKAMGRTSLESWSPVTPAERDKIQAQLELLLAHPLFVQSKRYPVLLRFVVEQTLAGNADQVKERLIGMEVFGRPPGYDANADPVVRVTAGEIRKRLAQYYYDPSHADELRIELPTGSYVPVFLRFVEPMEGRIAEGGTKPDDGPANADSDADQPNLQPPDAGQDQRGDDALLLLSRTRLSVAAGLQSKVVDRVQPGPRLVAEGVHAAGRSSAHPQRHPLMVNLLLVVLALAAGFASGYMVHQHRHPEMEAGADPGGAMDGAEQALMDFWQPVTAGPATVTFCLGEPARDASHDADLTAPIERSKLSEPLYFRLHESGLFARADVNTVTRMTGPLQKARKNYRVLAASEASFAQLREGPAVLIGAFDNLWTMRLTHDLRFGFASVDGNAAIVDHKSSAKTTWFTSWDLPYEKLARDYAIIARYRDAVTGQPVMIAAGISEEGTEAAGELISNPQDLTELLKKAPENWRNMNLEAVIETQVIDGHSGPPKVRAVDVW